MLFIAVRWSSVIAPDVSPLKPDSMRKCYLSIFKFSMTESFADFWTNPDNDYHVVCLANWSSSIVSMAITLPAITYVLAANKCLLK